MSQTVDNHESNRTVLGALVSAIRSAAAFDSNDQVSPAAILWTDEDRQWLDIIPRLRSCMPELLTLGTYDPANRTGPAIWIKCMIARPALLQEANWPETAVPVVYLPSVGKRQIRAVEEGSAELKQLAELQYRGLLWNQINGKDWTVRAFLSSCDGGLGLELAGDNSTLEAMRQALEKLLDVPVDRLRGRVLDAADFHELLAPDPARTLLDWLSDPAGFKTRSPAATWTAFRTICKERFSFDPEKSDVTKAGQLLAEREGAWVAVWARFEESPALYPGIRELLRRSKPSGTAPLFNDAGPSVYPQDDEAAETDLRAALVAVAKLSEPAARDRLTELEKTHSARRRLVWSKLKLAPLADAIQHLAELAELTRKPMGGASPSDMASQYMIFGWRADGAAMAAMAAVQSPSDLSAVGGAISTIYKPWLEKGAHHFQGLVKVKPMPSANEAEHVVAEPGCCLVFADGLRMDLGQRLLTSLQNRGVSATIGWRWSTIPSVTATAKPAASPLATRLSRTSDGSEFAPQIAATGKILTSDRFRTLLDEMGIKLLLGEESSEATDTAWTETGSIDHRGHSEQSRLTSLLDDELRRLTDRVLALLSAGWTRIQIVTDHGWLLLPGGLPKVSLAKFLTETRWGRCAVVKPGASPDCQQHGWHWNPDIQIAIAPGISCFREGHEYAHGGLSVQECVIPMISVGAGSKIASQGVTITLVSWNNLMGRVQIAGTGATAVDLRADGSDATTSLIESGTKPSIDADGRAKLYASDVAEGAEAEVVALDSSGNVLARMRTKVGGES